MGWYVAKRLLQAIPLLMGMPLSASSSCISHLAIGGKHV